MKKLNEKCMFIDVLYEKNNIDIPILITILVVKKLIILLLYLKQK